MSQFSQAVTQIFGVFTLLGDVLVLALVIGLILWALKVRPEFLKKVFAFFRARGILLAFLVALGSVAGSLFFSEIAQYEPCRLCWYQRIFMYPQVVLLGLALWRREKNIVPYSLALAVMGALIAAYHNYIQFTTDAFKPCPVGGLVSCVEKYFTEFGYITIPVMALTGFLLMIGFLTFTIYEKKVKRI